jgi:zinc carboxypeptidase
VYSEIIDWWQKLDQHSAIVKMIKMGMTDANFPLHLIIVSGDKDFNFESLHKKNKSIILINNGIHPGEPDGIDASMLLVRDIVTGKEKLPSNVVLAVIPVYNIGGCLDRSVNYRVDQNGPIEFGFRGNSQNLDLNRDFIKCDSKDARAFTELFHMIDPDVFLDNHVSNGADYQHVMTLIASQHNKLGNTMGEFMNKQFEPGLYLMMKEKGYDMVPYVNSFEDTPENGWPEFWDSPRYSSGYASLWHTFGFISETHMLKPFKQRVEATYALMQCFIGFMNKNNNTIRQLRKQTKQKIKTQTEFTLRWTLDKSIYSTISYKGYSAEHKPSDISGLSRLYYDRNKPFEKQIPFYNFYKPLILIEKPKAYIIPQGWWKVIDLLKLNKINMTQFKRDTVIHVSFYRVTEYKSLPRPFEAHHLNFGVKVDTVTQNISFRKGDYYILLNQEANCFLIETLEPVAEDSYFSWNFFDAVLSQKEGFSSYVFEETASRLLQDHPDIKLKLEKRMNSDTSFEKNADDQLNFIYQNSPYYEPIHLRYPVYRVK